MFHKKAFTVVSMIVLLVCLAAHAFAAGYLANTKSGKYHISTCRTIKHPNAAHFVPYDTEAECIAAGYTRCGVCFR